MPISTSRWRRSFGDNVLAALPDVIGQTVGGLVAGGIARNATMSPGEKAFLAEARRSANAVPVAEANPDYRDGSDIVLATALNLPIGGHPLMMSAGAGPNNEIRISHSNPVPQSLEEAQRQWRDTLAQIDGLKISSQVKASITERAKGIYDPYLDPTLYTTAREAPSLLIDSGDVTDYVDIGPASVPISAFSIAAFMPGVKYFAGMSDALGIYVNYFPKSGLNEFGTLLGIFAADAIGSLYRPAAETIAPKVSIRANKAAGDAIRDVIAARESPSMIEQSFTTVGGVRRVDVLKLGDETLAIESKVGRTSLGSRERQELARDWWLQRRGKLAA